MTNLDDRFRSLRLTRPPDLWPDIERRDPESEMPPTPSPARRAAIVALAIVVALAGLGFGFRVLRRAVGPVTVPATNTPSPPIAGPIALAVSSPSGPGNRIATMALDGTDLRLVTTGAEPDAYVQRYTNSSDGDPVWSPDGRTIAFIRWYAEGVNSLCEVNADGTGFRVVVRDLSGAELSWSPDGSTFAFYSEEDGAIHLIDADGSNERVLTHRVETVNDDFPAWSPDGGWIAFSSVQVWEIHPDGTGLTRLTDTPGVKSSPTWSPDGTKLLYTWERGDMANPTHSVWVQDPVGGYGQVSPDDGRNWDFPTVSTATVGAGNAILLTASDDRHRTIGLYLGNVGDWTRIGDAVPFDRSSLRPGS